MQKYLLNKFILLSFILSAPVFGLSAAQIQCTHTLSTQPAKVIETKKKLDLVFAQSFRSLRQYVCKSCQDNVFYLYRNFKKEIPELKPEDFNVLFIIPDTWLNGDNFLSKDRFRFKRARAKYEPQYSNTNIYFKHHVVLEYQGRIYDLDYTGHAKPVDKKEYFEDSFFNRDEIKSLEGYKPNIEKSENELQVVELPGEEYLNSDLHRPRGREFYIDIINRSESYTFREYTSN